MVDELNDLSLRPYLKSLFQVFSDANAQRLFFSFFFTRLLDNTSREHTFVSLSSQIQALEVLTSLMEPSVERPANLEAFLMDSALKLSQLVTSSHTDPHSLYFHQVVQVLDSFMQLSQRVSPSAPSSQGTHKTNMYWQIHAQLLPTMRHVITAYTSASKAKMNSV